MKSQSCYGPPREAIVTRQMPQRLSFLICRVRFSTIFLHSFPSIDLSILIEERQRIESTKVLPRKESTDERQREKMEDLSGKQSNKRQRTAHSKTNEDELKHSWICKSDRCQSEICKKFKKKIASLKSCENNCAEVLGLIIQHSKNCIEADCQICNFTVPCHVCGQHVETGNGWFCKECPSFEVCCPCYQNDAMYIHCHRLATQKDPWKQAELKMTKMMEVLTHSVQCRSPDCEHPNCSETKFLFTHKEQCTVGPRGGCNLCNKVMRILKMHVLSCEETECVVKSCRPMKDHFRTPPLGSGEDLPRKESYDERQKIESSDQPTKVLPRKESTDERQRERVEDDDHSKKIVVKIKKTVAVDVSNTNTIEEIRKKVQEMEGIASSSSTLFTISVPEIGKRTCPNDFLEA